ncbi:MAG: hypothetical protein JWM91_3759 [Rhodospirillales bacterium]|nr:hypothetical protein [Rhodospirillales bacterium]
MLLTLFYAVYNFDVVDRRKLSIAFGLQALMFVILYGAAEYHFRHNVGLDVENPSPEPPVGLLDFRNRFDVGFCDSGILQVAGKAGGPDAREL